MRHRGIAGSAAGRAVAQRLAPASQPRPRRLGRPGAHVICLSDERQAEEALVGQEALDDLAVVHPEVAEAGVAVRARPGSRRAVAPSRSTNRRSSPGAIGLRRRSTKWIATRRSLKKRRAARVARSSSRPKTWTDAPSDPDPLAILVGYRACVTLATAGTVQPVRGRGYHPAQRRSRVTVWFTVQLEDRPGSLARVAAGARRPRRQHHRHRRRRGGHRRRAHAHDQ